jgi:hypothetical protein
MKLQNVRYAMLLILIMLGTTCAYAEPVTLSCTNIYDAASNYPVTFDQSQGIAAFGTQSPTAATFTSTDITWQYNQNEPNGSVTSFSYDLNRVTARLTQSLNGRGSNIYACVLAKTQF